MTLKAIQTEYNGYLFRSRLEARWAVFFDALGVDYEYEPEGFELPSGDRYLPDFKVKCHGMRGKCFCFDTSTGLCPSCIHSDGDTYYSDHCRFVSAQGFTTGPNGITEHCDSYEQDSSRIFDLYIEVKGKMTKRDAARLEEFAKEHPILLVGDIPSRGHSDDSAALGSYDNEFGNINPFNSYTVDMDYFAAFPAADSLGNFYLWGDDSNYISEIDKVVVEEAYDIARKARFEFGETPVIAHG